MDTATLKRHQERLVEMRRRLVDRLNRMADAAVEDALPPGDVVRSSTHPADQDSEGLDIEMGVEKTEGELLNAVNLALERVERGTFGRCESCGQDISAERLEAIPYVPYCRGCEERHESESA